MLGIGGRRPRGSGTWRWKWGGILCTYRSANRGHRLCEGAGNLIKRDLSESSPGSPMFVFTSEMRFKR